MNYYPHHIGDYLRDTAHLSLLEHGAYRRMLDLYYASEKPLPLDTAWLCRLVRAEKETEHEAVQFVLTHFFEKCEDGWHNKRADAELRSAGKRIKAAKVNGKKGGRPITQRVATGLAKPKPEITQEKAPNNQKPIANNQEPNIKASGNGSRLNGAHHAIPKDESPILASLPLREGGEFPVRGSLVAELEPIYPNVDVPKTLLEMRGWLLLNEGRRKTRQGIKRFIGSWLKGEEEKYGGQA